MTCVRIVLLVVVTLTALGVGALRAPSVHAAQIVTLDPATVLAGVTTDVQVTVVCRVASS